MKNQNEINEIKAIIENSNYIDTLYSLYELKAGVSEEEFEEDGSYEEFEDKEDAIYSYNRKLEEDRLGMLIEIEKKFNTNFKYSNKSESVYFHTENNYYRISNHSDYYNVDEDRITFVYDEMGSVAVEY